MRSEFLETRAWALPRLAALDPAARATALEVLLSQAEIETGMIALAMGAAVRARALGVDVNAIGRRNLVEELDDVQLDLVAMIETVLGAFEVSSYLELREAWTLKIRPALDRLPLDFGRLPGEVMH